MTKDKVKPKYNKKVQPVTSGVEMVPQQQSAGSVFGGSVQEEITDKTIKSGDKIKVARVIGDMLGVENVESMSPDVAVNTGLRKIKTKRMTPELVGVLKKMLALASEVGIKVDHSLVPKAVAEGYVPDSAERNRPELPQKDKMTLGRLHDLMKKEKEKKAKQKGVIQRTGTDKVTEETLDEISKETLKSYIPKAMGSKSAADFTRGVKMAQGTGGEEELRAKSEKRSAGIHAAIKKLSKEEVELEEAIKLNSKVKIHAPGKDYHGEIGHVGEIRHGAYKGAPKTYTVDYGDRKSVQLGKERIKLHKEEVELDEGKMGQLSADIGQHIDKHVDRYKSEGGAEHLMSKIDHTAKKIAAQHGLEHKHAQKFVSDYVEKKLHEETIEEDIWKGVTKAYPETKPKDPKKEKELRASIDAAIISAVHAKRKKEQEYNKEATEHSIAKETDVIEKGGKYNPAKGIKKFSDFHKLKQITNPDGTLKPQDPNTEVNGENPTETGHTYDGAGDEDQLRRRKAVYKVDEEVKQQAHKVGVTVSDPNHPAASQRKEQQQKFVIVKATDKGEAQAKAESFYKKKGYKVHDSYYHSVQPATSMKTEEVNLEEAADLTTLRKQIYKHTELAIKANKAGDDEAVKKHQRHINAIKDKMAKLVRSEEVELDKLGPKQHKAIKDLRPGSKTAFDDNAGRQIHAHREGDKVHLIHHSATQSHSKTVDYSHFDENIEEDVHSADYKVNPQTGRKSRARHIEFAASKMGGTPEEGDEDGEPTSRKHKAGDPLMKPVKEEHDNEHEDVDDITDADLEKMAKEVDTEDEILDAYDDSELIIVDDETGEHVADIKEEVEQINEVLSRAERMRARIRFARSASKRARRLKVVLKTRSSAAAINRRARHLAVNLIKQRLVKKPVSQMTVGEKERAERMIAKRKNLINRLAMKLAPRVRRIENERLSHSKVTK